MKNSEKVKEIVEEIRLLIEKEKESLVIVEGKKDERALRALGFTDVVLLNKPLYEVVEGINAKRVLLLTDLDEEGKKLYSKLKKDLDKQGIRVDNKLRNLLFRTEIRQIEGLAKYLEK